MVESLRIHGRVIGDPRCSHRGSKVEILRIQGGVTEDQRWNYCGSKVESLRTHGEGRCGSKVGGGVGPMWSY